MEDGGLESKYETTEDGEIFELKLFNRVLVKIKKGDLKDTWLEQFILYGLIFKETISGVLFPIVDIGLDCLTAATHLWFGNKAYAGITLGFIGLPGLVASLVFIIRFLPKHFTLGYVLLSLLLLILSPFLYPLLQILINGAMVFMMIKHRSVEVFDYVGQNVKEFKSLEGFFESGPQFILQSYILLKGNLPHYGDLKSVDDVRVTILSTSILFSFLSLSKTGFNVNLPDPDERRRHTQDKSRAPFFWLTSLIFHLVCVLFRVSALAFFFITLRFWTFVIIAGTFIINLIILSANSVSLSMSLLMGALSIMMPNGYLLYNFAGTLRVDMLFEEMQSFLTWHMLSITLIFLASVGVSFGMQDSAFVIENMSDKSFLNDNRVFMFMSLGLILLGVMSILFGYVHYKKSIVPLYKNSDSVSVEEEIPLGSSNK